MQLCVQQYYSTNINYLISAIYNQINYALGAGGREFESRHPDYRK